MRFNFKKISALASSALMVGMSMGVAAAASYPAPFVVGGSADVAIVYGTGAGVSQLDLAQSVASINQNLQSKMGAAGTTTTGGTVTGGDSVLLAKSSDNLNIGDTWGTFTGTVDDSDLSTLLADGVYTADDNDDFDYEQTITLGTPTLQHFRDSDYEDLAGLDSKTPVVGFKLSSNTFVMNYTLDFIQDAESDIVSNDMDDIEGSDLTILGKTYYVSDFKNGTSSTYVGKLTLLDSANVGTVSEGETVTITSGGKDYEVSVAYLDNDEVKFVVNGENAPGSGKLQKGETYKLSDGSYIGARDISKIEVSGSTGSATFSIGSGKLEITGDGSDIKLNDDTIQGLKGYTYRSSGTSGTEKVDKIVLEWKTDEESFLTPESELVMPGFKAVKFSMNELMRPTEEKVTIDNDGDTSIGITVPIEDGDASFNILYGTSAGNFTGIGKASDERLATSNSSALTFTEKSSGTDYDKWFVATYASTSEAESYLLKATVQYNSGTSRNETDIINVVTGETVCDDYYNGKSCKIGDVSLDIGAVAYTSGGTESVALTAGSGVNFNTIYTKGGLRIYLPHLAGNTSTAQGAINFSVVGGDTVAGHDDDTWYLFMDGEDKDDTLASGTEFNLTLDNDGTTTNSLQVSQVNNAGTGGSAGLEVGTGTGNYEAYIVDEVAPRVMHYTKGDPDYAEVYYPSGDSETYAEIYLAETSAEVISGTTTTGSATQLGDVIVKDSEISSVSSKNLIIVGGSCINSAAATALGLSGATCGAGFTDTTGVGSGQFLIQSVGDAFTAGKIALVVAGYEAADTVNAAKYLTTQSVETMAGKKYVGTTATSAELQVETA